MERIRGVNLSGWFIPEPPRCSPPQVLRTKWSCRSRSARLPTTSACASIMRRSSPRMISVACRLLASMQCACRCRGTPLALRAMARSISRLSITSTAPSNGRRSSACRCCSIWQRFRAAKEIRIILGARRNPRSIGIPRPTGGTSLSVCSTA